MGEVRGTQTEDDRGPLSIQSSLAIRFALSVEPTPATGKQGFSSLLLFHAWCGWNSLCISAQAYCGTNSSDRKTSVIFFTNFCSMGVGGTHSVLACRHIVEPSPATGKQAFSSLLLFHAGCGWNTLRISVQAVLSYYISSISGLLSRC
jgi:hypothetical protein